MKYVFCILSKLKITFNFENLTINNLMILLSVLDLLIFYFCSLPNKTVQNNCNNYNYDKWMLNVSNTDGIEKTFNILVRNKPHGIQVRISEYVLLS